MYEESYKIIFQVSVVRKDKTLLNSIAASQKIVILKCRMKIYQGRFARFSGTKEQQTMSCPIDLKFTNSFNSADSNAVFQ